MNRNQVHRREVEQLQLEEQEKAADAKESRMTAVSAQARSPSLQRMSRIRRLFAHLCLCPVRCLLC